MRFLSRLLNRPAAWTPQTFPKPWAEERESIYRYVQRQTKNGTIGFSEGSNDLPDESLFYKDDSVRWAAGAMDGVLIHHGSKEEGEQKQVKEIYLNVINALNSPNRKNLSLLYQGLLHDSIPALIDDLLPMFVEAKNIPYERLRDLGLWLATKAPDRQPVKVGIGILGLFTTTVDEDIIFTLGLHEEFSLYAAVALKNKLENPEEILWRLAQKLHGWGKIQIVERLSGTKNPMIKAWMVREGYKNYVMDEYLAGLCAVTGGLRTALETADPDEALLIGAGDMLEALMRETPVAMDIHDYKDGAEVTRLYLSHLKGRELSLQQFLTLEAIKNFVERQGANWEKDEGIGWTPTLRSHIAQEISVLLQDPSWRAKTLAALQNDKTYRFHHAAQVAQSLGIDPWPYYYARQKAEEGDYWYWLTRTKDKERIDQTIELARALIPLREIAAGVDKPIAIFEAESQHHRALGSVMRTLSPFPGKGWDLVKVAFQSPLPANRTGALDVLTAWGQENWPVDAKDVLRQAFVAEPDATIKGKIGELISSRTSSHRIPCNPSGDTL